MPWIEKRRSSSPCYLPPRRLHLLPRDAHEARDKALVREVQKIERPPNPGPQRLATGERFHNQNQIPVGFSERWLDLQVEASYRLLASGLRQYPAQAAIRFLGEPANGIGIPLLPKGEHHPQGSRRP